MKKHKRNMDLMDMMRVDMIFEVFQENVMEEKLINIQEGRLGLSYI